VQDWEEILKSHEKDEISYQILKNSLRKGVPDLLRGKIWLWLGEVKKRASVYLKNDLYKKLKVSESKADT
jgi:hypothetical protein